MAPTTHRSRRTATRGSENISQAGSSQQQDVDAASEDEVTVAPPATARRSTKGKVKKEQQPTSVKTSSRKQSKRVEEEVDDDADVIAEDGENEPEEVFDKEKYLNQPLNKQEGERINGYGTDWEGLRKNFRNEAVEIAKLLAGDMAEYAQNHTDAKEPEELENIMKEILDLDQAFILHTEALSDLHQRVKIGEEIAGVVDQYGALVKKKKGEYAAKTARQKYAKDEDYNQFKQNIYEVNHPGDAMPPITEFIPREDGDESDDEDDVQVGGVTQDYKCPITLTTLINPMTSQLCRHSFSGEAIREFLKNGPKRCPASGCNKQIALRDLKDDKQLARKIRDVARREQMRERDESDIEEIID